MLFLALASAMAPLSAPPALERMTLGLRESRLLTFPSLMRAAVADSAVVTVKTAPPRSLLLFGKKEGRTTVTVWVTSEQTRELEVTVLPLARGEPLATEGRLVRVALEFIEINRQRLEELGVRWPSHEGFSIQSGLSFSGLNLSAQFFGAHGLIHHFGQRGEARLLSRPELFVREGEEAIFHSGGEFPVTSSTENYGRFHRHLDWKPYGMNLKIRPRSHDGFHISSEVQVEISELNTGLAMEGIPSLSRRKIETKVDSIENEPLILSGLQRARASDGREEVPLLTRLPVVGPIFGSRREDRESIELILALTLSFTHRDARARLKGLRERVSEEVSDGP